MKTLRYCCSGFNHALGDQDAHVAQESIGPLYDRLARCYDIWGELTETRARRRAIELAETRDGESILEVAVGTGPAFAEIVKRNPRGRNIGIDLSAGMLARAERRLQRQGASHYRLSAGSALDLQVESGSIDLLVNNYMFDLLPYAEMDHVLSEFKRVLKPGGRLVLVNMTHGEGFGSGLYAGIYRLSPRLMGGCRGVRMADRLTRQGFTVITREYHQQLLFPSEVIAANLATG